MANVKPIPEGYHSVTPYLIITREPPTLSSIIRRRSAATELFAWRTAGELVMLRSRLATRRSCCPMNTRNGLQQSTNPRWYADKHHDIRR